MHVRRRPSAAMIVSVVALFASLGGVGYAATTLPSGSVGTAQLQSGAVSNGKIKNGAVGHGKLAAGAVGKTQINSSQVQARVTGTCASGAIAAVASGGGVTCASTMPQEFDASSASPVTVPDGTSATAIATESLNGGSSYLVLANPDVQITNATDHQQVQVTCKLAVGPTTGAQQTRTWSTEIGSQAYDQENAIPLVVTAPSSANSITANVTCTRTYTGGGSSPTVTVSSNINALQTASNTTAGQTGGSSG
jgi:hypothetical protein